VVPTDHPLFQTIVICSSESRSGFLEYEKLFYVFLRRRKVGQLSWGIPPVLYYEYTFTSPVLLGGVFTFLLQNFIWSLNQTGVLHVTENGFRCSCSFMALTYHQHRNSTTQICQRKLPLRQRWQHKHSRHRVTPAHAAVLHHRSTSTSVRGVWPVDLWFSRSVSRREDVWCYVRCSMTANRFLVTVTAAVTPICATGDMVLTILQWVAL
jgi:hypothetical protein